MAKQTSKVLTSITWFTGIVVSLAVAFSMTGNGALNQSIPWLSGIGNGILISIVGWIVVLTTLIGAIMAILKK